MVAMAQISPADLAASRRNRLTVVRPAVVRPGVVRVPTATRPTAGRAAAVRPPVAAVYRRRRAVALLVVVAVAAALILALAGLFSSFGPAPAPASPADRLVGPGAVYVVQPGDTFWAIARRLQPGGDPRPLVARLVAAHGGAALRTGERLSLPVS